MGEKDAYAVGGVHIDVHVHLCLLGSGDEDQNVGI